MTELFILCVIYVRYQFPFLSLLSGAAQSSAAALLEIISTFKYYFDISKSHSAVVSLKKKIKGEDTVNLFSSFVVMNHE